MTKARPKLLFVGHLPPPAHGVSVSNQRLLDGGPLHEAFDVDILPIQSIESMKEIETTGKLALNKAKRAVQLFPRLARRLKGVDLVYYTPGLFGLAVLRDALLMQVCQARGVPYCLHIHNERIGHNYEGQPDHPVIRKLHRRMLNNARMNILLHESFHPFGGLIEAHVPWRAVFNGVPIPAPQPLKHTGPFRLCYIGNIHHIKGFTYAVDAMAQLPGVHLDVVGNFSSETYAQEIHRKIESLGLKDRVHFHGRRPPETAWEPLEDSQVLIFPSHIQEGLPLVWLEAMARGKAVASFDVGCARGVLGSVAKDSVVERRDVDALVATLKDWDRNRSKLQRIRRKARKQAQEIYSVAAWQQRVTDALVAALD
ncbi:MAG: hypothetical protein CMH55_05165 [Myxococcales bacterium]|nr:hypothetical protein [Myxococcales bacterium]